ncbi:MAG TPA: alkaline phosphatase family protein [Casimicrobiaceae bacterium]|jgi:predicted AlkP superfamily phosphohydrolase/phosphomutase
MTRKVALLGIDAGNRYLLEQWAGEGRLPALRRLLERGLKGRTMSLPGLFTGATWPSFQTGVNPARSGVYSWMQIAPGTYEQRRCLTGEQLRREPFWNHLGRAGRSVTVIDVPLSAPSAGLNGVQLLEWGAHDAQYRFTTWPPALAREVESRFGRHPMGPTCNANRDTAGYVELRDRLVQGVRKKGEITRHFLRRADWTFFASVFGESHCVGHQCWHLHDPAHPRHDDAQARAVGDPMLDVYAAIDAEIGETLKCIDEDTIVVVLASHGMGYKYGPQFLLDRILLGLGVAAPAPSAEPAKPPRRRRDALDPLLTWGWQRTPKPLRSLLQPVRAPLRDWMLPESVAPAPLVDPAASLCFRVENNHAHAGIRVNLAGREPQGKVAPGAAYDAFCDALARDLLDVVDLDTGQHVAERVLRTDDLYRGEHRDVLPDLLVEWSDYAPISRIRLGSPKLAEIAGEYRFCRSGDHFPGGMFVATGPGIAAGTLDRTVSIMDFAPTFCSMLGVELPDVDGVPIHELVTPARRMAPRVR